MQKTMVTLTTLQVIGASNTQIVRKRPPLAVRAVRGPCIFLGRSTPSHLRFCEVRRVFSKYVNPVSGKRPETKRFIGKPALYVNICIDSGLRGGPL